MQFTTGQSVELHQFVVQGLATGQQPPCMLQHQLSLARQAELATAAFHQRAIEVALQGLDTAAEGRLAEIDRLGSPHKTAVVGQGNQVAKLTKVHYASPAFIRCF
ncbi:hypothetical protein D3C80_1757190 [compost metagenome]